MEYNMLPSHIKLIFQSKDDEPENDSSQNEETNDNYPEDDWNTPTDSTTIEKGGREDENTLRK